MITGVNRKTNAWLRTTRPGVRISPSAPINQTLTTDYRTVRPPYTSNPPIQNTKLVANRWCGGHQWVINFRGSTVVWRCGRVRNSPVRLGQTVKARIADPCNRTIIPMYPKSQRFCPTSQTIVKSPANVAVVKHGRDWAHSRSGLQLSS